MILLKLALKPIKLALKLFFFVFFKLPLKIFFNFPFYIAFIFLFHVLFKFISLTAFILARSIWPSVTSHSIFADPDKLPTSTRPTTPASNSTIIPPSDPDPTPPSGADLTPPLNPAPAPPLVPNPLLPSDNNPTPPVNQDPVANPALPSDTDLPPISSPTTPPTAPYTMNVRIHQTGMPYFMLVEEGVWHFANGGTWTACEGQLVLKMGGSGTSGLLRFSDGADSFFIVALGVHNYKPWLDVSSDLARTDTVVAVHSDWYKDGSERAKNREAQREKVETKDKKGNALSASISKSADHEFWITVIIGQE